MTETYNANKHEYFTYHLQIASAFQKDCEKLLISFESEDDLSFKIFAKTWRNMNFSLIFNGTELTEELKFFIESCFSTIQKYIIFCEKTAIRVGAFYMLYGVYFKQPAKHKIRIRCTVEIFKFISNLAEKMQEKGTYDVPYLLQKLKLDSAFKLVISPNTYALEGRFMWQEKELKNDIFEEIKQGDPFLQTRTVLQSQEFYGLDSICNVGNDYVDGLRKYGISEKFCEAVTNLPAELETLLNEMKNSDRNSSEIKNNAQKLKNKAFTSKVSQYRS